MPEINPTRFFRFAADYSSLLSALYYSRERISEADLLAQIRRFAQPVSPAATHVLDQLLALGFVEPSPAATADYEMTRHFANILGVLLRQFRLTSVRVIQAYVDSLQNLGVDLSEMLTAGNDAQVVRVLNDTSDNIERLRLDSRNNRDAIIAETVQAKVNLERLTVRDRFVGINRLWTSHIIPLRDMIDESKVLDATLDELDRVLRWGAGEKSHEPVLHRELQGAASRLRRMRRDVARDFHESLQEISPLYHELQRDTGLVRGAVMALERCDRKGSRSLELPRRLALPVWRMEGQLDEEEMRAYLYGIRDFKPPVPRPLKEGSVGDAAFFIEPDEMARRLGRDLPLVDAWEWLLQEYPQVGTAQILRAHARLRDGAYGPVKFGAAPHSYLTATHEITAYPLEVAKKNG